MTAQEVIELLQLEPLHPEGGFFRRTFESRERGACSWGERAFGTAILYLLTKESFSAFHRVRGAELFHFYSGDPAVLLQLREHGEAERTILGTAYNAGERPQALVQPGRWQALQLAPQGRLGWALLGCTVTPGFEFADFELGSRPELLRLYPWSADLIRQLTRE